MADFCLQCAKDLGLAGTDLAGLTNPILEAINYYGCVLCEGCGPIQVDSKGRCVSHFHKGVWKYPLRTNLLGPGPLNLRREEAAAFFRSAARDLKAGRWRCGLRFGWMNGRTRIIEEQARNRYLSGILSRRAVADALERYAIAILTNSELVGLRFELHGWTLITEAQHWHSGQPAPGPWGFEASRHQISREAK